MISAFLQTVESLKSEITTLGDYEKIQDHHPLISKSNYYENILKINKRKKVAVELAIDESFLLLFIVRSTLFSDDFSIINWSL